MSDRLHGLADVVEFPLESEAVESLQRKAEEETDSAVKTPSWDVGDFELSQSFGANLA